MTRSITLRIKKIYFDAIADGSKKFEYRAYSDFYRRMFEKEGKIDSVTLHYQLPPRLTCRVTRIEVIPHPEHLKNDPAFPGKQVFRIGLREPKRWSKRS